MVDSSCRVQAVRGGGAGFQRQLQTPWAIHPEGINCLLGRQPGEIPGSY
jgi:hypothetical protein